MSAQPIVPDAAPAAIAAAGVSLAGLGLAATARPELAALAALLGAAVWEEVLFRGVVQGGLLGGRRWRRAWGGVTGANLIASTLFCAAHLWQQPPLLLPGYFVLSIALGVLRERTRSVAWAILAHAALNLLWWMAVLSGMPRS